MTMTTEEIFKELCETHLMIKEHPFRLIYTDPLSDNFSQLGISYIKLIRKTVELIGDLAYNTKEFEYLKNDMWWAHNFCAGLWTFRYRNLESKYSDNEHKDKREKTNFNTTIDIMLWLEKYIMYLHRFIETKQLNGIVHVDYECQELPHNGWYYYHATEYIKDKNGEWKLKSPISYVDKDYPTKLEAYLKKRKEEYGY